MILAIVTALTCYGSLSLGQYAPDRICLSAGVCPFTQNRPKLFFGSPSALLRRYISGLISLFYASSSRYIVQDDARLHTVMAAQNQLQKGIHPAIASAISD